MNTGMNAAAYSRLMITPLEAKKTASDAPANAQLNGDDHTRSDSSSSSSSDDEDDKPHTSRRDRHHRSRHHHHERDSKRASPAGSGHSPSSSTVLRHQLGLVELAIKKQQRLRAALENVKLAMANLKLALDYGVVTQDEFVMRARKLMQIDETDVPPKGTKSVIVFKYS